MPEVAREIEAGPEVTIAEDVDFQNLAGGVVADEKLFEVATNAGGARKLVANGDVVDHRIRREQSKGRLDIEGVGGVDKSLNEVVHILQLLLFEVGWE